MGKIIYWIASIFCFILVIISILVAKEFFILTSAPVVSSSSMPVLFAIFFLPPAIFLVCGMFYLNFALGKRKSNIITKISLVSLFLIPTSSFIFLYFLTMSIRNTSTDALQGLGVLVLSIFIYGVFSLIQFILTLIGFLIAEKK